MKDKYTATWVSPSSISDFNKCPRAYYLNNVYKDPKTNHKISIINPPLALGQIVHEVLESLSTIPTDQRFQESLVGKLDKIWHKISSSKGGFRDENEEYHYKQKAITMLKNIQDNPGPLKNKAVKINMDLPHYWLSEEDNIILCGKIDWLEYLPDSDSVHIIDFKTGQKKENKDSLQLPIYHLLVHNCQTRKATKASYWYLHDNSGLTPQKLPKLTDAAQKVMVIAKQIKLARQLERFKCPAGSNGCKACVPLEDVIAGKAKLIGSNDYGQDLYILNKPLSQHTVDSVIL